MQTSFCVTKFCRCISTYTELWMINSYVKTHIACLVWFVFGKEGQCVYHSSVDVKLHTRNYCWHKHGTKHSLLPLYSFHFDQRLKCVPELCRCRTTYTELLQAQRWYNTLIVSSVCFEPSKRG